MRIHDYFDHGKVVYEAVGVGHQHLRLYLYVDADYRLLQDFLKQFVLLTVTGRTHIDGRSALVHRGIDMHLGQCLNRTRNERTRVPLNNSPFNGIGRGTKRNKVASSRSLPDDL